MPADAVPGEEQDDGGAHVEAAQFLAAGEALACFAGCGGRASRGVPDGFQAAHEERADHHDGHLAGGGIEHERQAFVAGVETRDQARGGGVDGEQAAGDVAALAQLAVDGDMYAVVVARGEVEGGVGAASEGGGPPLRQEFFQAIAAAFSLEQFALARVADAANRAIDRGEDAFGIRRASSGTQGAREEFAEVPVGTGVGGGGEAHVHPVVADEASDQQVLPGFPAPADDPAEAAAQQVVG